MVFLILILVGIAGGYYYFVHRAYSDSQVLALIRANVLPSIVQIYCANEDGGEEAIGGSGTYVISSDGNPAVITNAHVVLGQDGKYHGCNVYFPRPTDGSFYDSVYVAGDPLRYDNLYSTVAGMPVEGIDYVLLPLTAAAPGTSYPFPPIQKDAYMALQHMCRGNGKPVQIGDTVYVIGYPDVGGESITLTQGVVSGFEDTQQEYIKISDNTSHGNSGGLAVGSNGCLIGIPTAATFQAGGNLGFVLSNDFIDRFMEGLTGETTYEPPTRSGYATKEYDLPDFSLTYPADWDVSTTTSSSGNQQVLFSAPSEGALDAFQESFDVEIVPHADAALYSKTIDQFETAAKQYSQIQTGFATGSSGEWYYVQYVDDSESLASVPIVVNEFIPPERGGNLYTFVTLAEEGKELKTYTTILGSIFDSIHPR